MTKNKDEVEAVKAATMMEPAAVRGAEEAKADKDLPDPDTDTEQANKAAKVKDK